MEINTYIVNPTYRGNGLAKILLYEALKRKMEDYFLHTDNDVLYLNTTIHNDNINSQKIISIIKMEDYLYIERTKGINRRVYFKKVCRDNYQDLLHEMEIEFNRLQLLFPHIWYRFRTIKRNNQIKNK